MVDVNAVMMDTIEEVMTITTLGIDILAIIEIEGNGHFPHTRNEISGGELAYLRGNGCRCVLILL